MPLHNKMPNTKVEKTTLIMFVSHHQNSGQRLNTKTDKDYIQKYGTVQIYKNYNDK